MIIGTADTRTATRPASFRWKAFAIHLALSLVVLGVLLYLLFVHWFPGYLFDTDGGWQALRVIAGVDIVLGPMLTLIAANPSKSTRELRQDFSLIALVQVCALSAGTWLAWDNRPWAMLWYDGMVYSMPWSAMRDEPQAVARIRELSPLSPHWVTVNLPLDPQQRGIALARARDRGTDPLFDPSFYGTWPPPPEAVRAFATLAVELEGDPDGPVTRAWQARAPGTDLMPVRGRYDAYFLTVDVASGQRLAAVRVTPPERLLAGSYPILRLQDLLRIPAEVRDKSTAPTP